MIVLIRNLAAAVAGVVVFVPALPALAADVAPYGDDQSLRFDVELGVGGVVYPKYEGSSDYRVAPYPIFQLRKLHFGSLDIDATDLHGFSFAPAFRYLEKRKSAKSAKLGHLPNADATLELGLTVAYEQEYWRVFGTGLFGVTGADGFFGELGADLILHPAPQWTFNLGPRVTFADNSYMDYYFGVPAGHAPLAQYNPDGGLRSAGLETSVRYDFNADWSAEGVVGWNRLVGDAGKSPVTKAGSADQFVFKLGVLRRFQFGY